MRIIDLTHTIHPGMPVYPGTEPPVFACGTSLERDGFIEKRITLFSHTGTHIDAPAHILKDGPTLDRIDAARFIGSAAIVPAEAGEGGTITKTSLAPFESRLRKARFVILKTGWAARWGSPSYFGRYPTLDAEAARWLAGFDPWAVCVDAISVDTVDSFELPIHRIFMSHGCCIVENLANLDAVDAQEFTLSCLPLKLVDADGSPVRAVAILPE